MKFAADEMLGKLARWLRFMGLDVIYRRPFDDDELIEIAQRENRIILTRDKKIIEKCKRKNLERQNSINFHFITEDLPFDQMREVVSAFRIDPFENAFTRCAVCNTSLLIKDKKEVAGKAPPFVYATINEYRECPQCERIYWHGSHRKRIESILGEVKKQAMDFKPEK